MGIEFSEDSLKASVPYQGHKDATALNIEITLVNLFSKTKLTIEDEYLRSMSIDVGRPIGNKGIEGSVLEIEIPVSSLHKLYKAEKSLINPILSDHFNEQVDVHLRTTGRGGKGPEINFLISEAHTFLARLITTITNETARAFTAEFGGQPPLYYTEMDWLRSTIVLNNIDGKRNIHRIFLQSPGSGVQIDSRSLQFAVNRSIDTDLPFKVRRSDALRRVEQMYRAGFGFEAVTLSHTVLEVEIKDAVRYGVSSEAANRIDGMLGGRLATLLKIVSSEGPNDILRLPLFIELIDLFDQITDIRNAYVHRLEIKMDKYWSATDVSRRIEEIVKKISDPHWRDTRIGLIYEFYSKDQAMIDLIEKEVIK